MEQENKGGIVVENISKAIINGRALQIAPNLFEDVAAFHEKFGLRREAGADHKLPDDVFEFRRKFLREEISEYEAANDSGDMEKALDSLVDLVYVALGTAYLHGFDKFNEAWSRVQAANLMKVKCEGAHDERSTRGGHRIDVVKPTGWKAPDLSDLL